MTMPTSSDTTPASSTVTYHERRTPTTRGELHVHDYPGAGPAFVMLHGFPDNLRIFEPIAPLLASAGRRVVLFDFLGAICSRSTRTDRHPPSAISKERGQSPNCCLRTIVIGLITGDRASKPSAAPATSASAARPRRRPSHARCCGRVAGTYHANSNTEEIAAVRTERSASAPTPGSPTRSDRRSADVSAGGRATTGGFQQS